MGQKRSKNQIRRERQKLRKLVELEGKSQSDTPLNSENVRVKPEEARSTSAASLKESIPDEEPKTKKESSNDREKSPETADVAGKANSKSEKNNVSKSDSRQNGLIPTSATGTASEQVEAKFSGDEQPVTKVETDDKIESLSTESVSKPNDNSPSKHGNEESSVITTSADFEPSQATTGNEQKPQYISSEAITNSGDNVETKPVAKSVEDDDTLLNEKVGQDKSDVAANGGEDESANKTNLMKVLSTLKHIPEPSKETEEGSDPESDSDLLSQYANIFHKFQTPKDSQQNQVVTYTPPEYSSTDPSSSDDSDDEEFNAKRLSKRQKRIREKIPISVLKASTNKPQSVEWYDADAPDPFLAIYSKTVMNHVRVPSHWQQKKEYLSSKRGVERAPFQLPKFIENTGISEMRNHDPDSLKKSQRDRVQPKMGRLDIDYQKLHDAFFKHQTKPKVLPFGELYSEGREKLDQQTDDISHMRPGKISKALRLAVGMSENERTPPPWITVMQQLGKPPSYSNLLIPGMDTDYTNAGYSIQFGEQVPSLALSRETWGKLEDGEESEIESEEVESEQDEEDSPVEMVDTILGAAKEKEHPLDENGPERVEIAEYSRIKTNSKVASDSPASSSGGLYTVLKEKSTESPGALVGGKQRYEIGEKRGSEDKKKIVEKQKAQPEEGNKFKF